jgi:hypothetical protein
MEQFFARSFHSFGVNSKTSKSKADENQILNKVQKLFATCQPHRECKMESSSWLQKLHNELKASCKKLFHFYSLWQEIIFTVVNELRQNQSLTFSKLKLNKKRKSKR